MLYTRLYIIGLNRGRRSGWRAIICKGPSIQEVGGPSIYSLSKDITLDGLNQILKTLKKYTNISVYTNIPKLMHTSITSKTNTTSNLLQQLNSSIRERCYVVDFKSITQEANYFLRKTTLLAEKVIQLEETGKLAKGAINPQILVSQREKATKLPPTKPHNKHVNRQPVVIKENIFVQMIDLIKLNSKLNQFVLFAKKNINKPPHQYSNTFYSQMLDYTKKDFVIPKKQWNHFLELPWIWQTFYYLKKQEKANLKLNHAKITAGFFYTCGNNNGVYSTKPEREFCNYLNCYFEIPPFPKYIKQLYSFYNRKTNNNTPTVKSYENNNIPMSSKKTKVIKPSKRNKNNILSALRNRLNKNCGIDEVVQIMDRIEELKKSSHFSYREQRDFLELQDEVKHIFYGFITLKDELKRLDHKLDYSNYFEIKEILSDLDKLEPKNAADRRKISELHTAASVKMQNLEWQYKKEHGKKPLDEVHNFTQTFTNKPIYTDSNEMHNILGAFYDIAQESISKRNYGLPGTVKIPLYDVGYTYAWVKEISGRFICELLNNTGELIPFNLYTQHSGINAVIQVVILVNIADIVRERDIKVVFLSNKGRMNHSWQRNHSVKRYPLKKYKVINNTSTIHIHKPKRKQNYKQGRVWHYRYYGPNFRCDEAAIKRALKYTGIAYIPDGFTFVSPSYSTSQEHPLIESNLAKSFYMTLAKLRV